MKHVALVLALMLTCGARVWAAEPVRVTDIAGTAQTPLNPSGKKAAVLLFITGDCPICNAYAPEVKRLCADYTAKGIAFFIVHVDPKTTAEQARKHATEYGFDCPIVLDTAGTLVKAVGAHTTPEAFLVSPESTLLYHGRIDDRFIDFGKSRAEATQHDLRRALDEVLAGKPVSVPTTKAVGCYIGTPEADAGRQLTFNKDIAPIVYQNCAACHRDGDVAPFPLLSYDDVKKRAKQIAAVTHSRYMPPWKAEPGWGEFAGERRLTDAQIVALRKWADDGCIEGDAADKISPPKFVDGWQLGTPDLILKMPEAYAVPAEGRDVFRCFVLPTNLDEDKYVQAVEYHPSDRAVVHHALFFLDSSGTARKKDEKDPGPGFSSFGGPGFIPTGGLGGWAPGAFPQKLPDGTARLLKKGSDVVIQTHFHPTGKVEHEQSELGIYFAKKKPERILAGLTLGNRNIDIPAGQSDYNATASFVTPIDVELEGITPHAHLVCKDMKATATLPDGSTKQLLWIKDWDFNWQGQYQYVKPIKLPKGTTINMEYLYDNSAENFRNPNNPPKRVHFGEQTADEMAFLFCSVVAERPAELPLLRLAMFQQMLKSRFARNKPTDPATPPAEKPAPAKEEPAKEELKMGE
jgi:mono/diheme cytochrome c family protein